MFQLVSHSDRVCYYYANGLATVPNALATVPNDCKIIKIYLNAVLKGNIEPILDRYLGKKEIYLNSFEPSI